ncbi:MAG: 50S ribosomal protein L13 [Patescibacteria group bacterium]
MKTYQPKAKEVKRNWHLIDAKGQVLGRLSTKISGLLMGKGKTNYSTHMDMGDFVVVLNSENIEVTGKKSSQKVYRRHSGYPNGLKEESYKKILENHPERIITHAVNGMLPDNRLKNERLKRLKVVIGSKNPYESKF